MTGKEALKEYREIYVDKTFKGKCCPTQDWYLEIIEEELEKISKKENAIKVGERFLTTKGLLRTYCPKCNEQINIYRNRYRYCPYCSQKLDWGDENE